MSARSCSGSSSGRWSGSALQHRPAPGQLPAEGRRADGFLDFGNTAAVPGDWTSSPGGRSRPRWTATSTIHERDGRPRVREQPRPVDRELLFKQAVEVMDWYLYDRELRSTPTTSRADRDADRSARARRLVQARAPDQGAARGDLAAAHGDERARRARTAPGGAELASDHARDRFRRASRRPSSGGSRPSSGGRGSPEVSALPGRGNALFMPLYCCEACGWATTGLRVDAVAAHQAQCPECAGLLRLTFNMVEAETPPATVPEPVLPTIPRPLARLAPEAAHLQLREPGLSHDSLSELDRRNVRPCQSPPASTS